MKQIDAWKLGESVPGNGIYACDCGKQRLWTPRTQAHPGTD
ncbi:hypothetical protein ACFWBI_01025 [Streptomyces sp. NPDC059982]